MAIDQHPRENLLLEATAYNRRCLFRVPRAVHWTAGLRGSAEHSICVEPFQQQDEWELFVGLRADERWSIYFDEQPVLQFNRQNHLRRLFAAGQRYAANSGRLHRLDRAQLGGQVRMQQVALDEVGHAAVRHVCQKFIAEAVQALHSGRARRVGEFPAGDTAWLAAFEHRLKLVANGFTIAAGPAH